MKKSIVAAAVFAGALMAGPAAHAGDVDIGISIGIPGVTRGGPTYYYAPPPPPRRRHHHDRPRVVVVPGPAYVAGPGYRPGWADRGHYDRHPHQYRKENWKHNRGHRGHGRND
ncbi:virulence factor [Castellaniella hirudinis]|uniref:virulence factor n=1 Tax=Castellaniella hirudinis TaxID=1144617 RepID=UPI0039C3BE32